ncbi:MAG: fibronectin type III domain-containing protein [Acidobacteriota bacterium]
MRKRTTRAFYRALLLPVAIALVIVHIGCGKIGEPLPPIPRAPLIVSELTAVQRGTRLIIKFPLTRTPRSGKIARVAVYRLIEPADAPPGLPEEEFSTRSSVIYEIPGDTIPLTRSIITYEDTITLAPGQSAQRYRYAVRLFTAAGVPADFSNYAMITPVLAIAKPPGKLDTSLSQNEITIAWTTPTENESGTTPANVAGYNIYRRTDAAPARLNPRPLTEASYQDRAFQFGTEYRYFVRALSLPGGVTNLSEAIESNDSEVVSLKPKDTFPPGAPDSIKIASINGIVSMFWPSNPEADLAGYFIYRSEDENLPPARWVKLTPRVHTPTTFRDDKVVVGKKYLYQISAADTSGNEGKRSGTVAEVVNP